MPAPQLCHRGKLATIAYPDGGNPDGSVGFRHASFRMRRCRGAFRRRNPGGQQSELVVMKTTMAACAAAIPTSASLIALTGLFNGVCLRGARNTPPHPPFGQSFARAVLASTSIGGRSWRAHQRGSLRAEQHRCLRRPDQRLRREGRRSLSPCRSSKMEPRPGAIRDRGSLDNYGP